MIYKCEREIYRHIERKKSRAEPKYHNYLHDLRVGWKNAPAGLAGARPAGVNFIEHDITGAMLRSGSPQGQLSPREALTEATTGGRGYMQRCPR